MALSFFANKYAKFILGVAVYDLTAGFSAIRRSTVAAILSEKNACDGYGFQIETKYNAIRKGFRLKEVPVQFKDRVRGRSKISRCIIWDALLLVLKLRFRSCAKNSGKQYGS